MRKIFLFLLLAASYSLNAQTSLPFSPLSNTGIGAFTPNHLLDGSNLSAKKWSLSSYAGFSAGLGYYNGGYSSAMSVPIGLQINRRINNNLYAFAGISAAPAIYNVNSAFMNSGINKYTTGTNRFNSGSLGMYSKFEAGLMYINDSKTFSISGSIGVSQSNYPVYPYYNGPHSQKQPVMTSPHQ